MRRTDTFVPLVACAGLLLFAMSGVGVAATKNIWQNEDGRFTIGGEVDLKIRSRSNNPDDEDENTWRVRLRMNGEFVANEYISAGFRIATSTGTSSSHHGTLTTGDGGEDKTDFGIDRAYLKLKADGYYLWAGKNRINIWNPAQFLWDWDIQPEGVALGYKARAGGNKIGIGLGYFVFSEADWDTDNYMLTYQAAFATGGDLGIKGAIGGFTFNDAAETGTGWNVGGNNIGQIPGGSYNITHAMLELKANDSPYKPRFGLAYAISDASDYWGQTTDTTTGATAGVALAQEDKQAMIVYIRAVVEQVDIRAYYWDVGYASAPALGMFGQDEFPMASNFTGYHLQAEYEVDKNISVGLRYFHQETKNKDIAVWNSGVAMEGEMELDAVEFSVVVSF